MLDLKYTSAYLLTYHCHFCHQACSQACICDNCLNWLLAADAGDRCTQCGEHLAHSGAKCKNDHKTVSHLDGVHTLISYGGLVSHLIKSLKHQKQLKVLPVLQTLIHHLYDLHGHETPFLPVPTHWTRSLVRGFDHTKELCRTLPQKLNQAGLISRAYSPKLERLNAKQRKSALNNNFFCKRAVELDSIVLIDDVTTTGTTMNEVAGVLKKQGVKRVVGLALCKTEKQ